MEMKVLNEICLITEYIRVYFPSYYVLLSEIPLSISNDNVGIIEDDLEEHLETLQSQIKHFQGLKGGDYIPTLLDHL